MQKLMAEFIGTALLLIGVVGSGIMAEALSGGNTGLALLANAIATGAMLYAIITTLGPISGAHFNPAVTLYFCARKELEWRVGFRYVPAQIAGGILGVWISHLMFDLPLIQFSETARQSTGLLVSEVVATFGLLFVIVGGLRSRPDAIPALVGLYITGAYWFTSSTSFANPAVTIARMFSNTFAGIMPSHAPAFIVMQVFAVGLSIIVLPRLFERNLSQ